MPGSPIKRARRAAREGGLALRNEMMRTYATIADRSAEEEAWMNAPMGRPGISTSAPVPTASRAKSARDLYASMLAGAESALDRLNAGVSAGMDARELKELAVTSNVLMRAAKLLEDKKPNDDEPTVDEMEQAEAEAERLLAAKKGRG